MDKVDPTAIVWNLVGVYVQVRERDFIIVFGGQIWPMRPKNIIFHVIRVKVSIDPQYSRALLINVVIGSAQCDYDKNFSKDRLGSNIHRAQNMHSGLVSWLIPQYRISHWRECELIHVGDIMPCTSCTLYYGTHDIILFTIATIDKENFAFCFVLSL